MSLTQVAAPVRRLPMVPAAAFVLVWSSGYIAGPAAVHAAAPFTVLGWRFALAAALGAVVALALRRPFRMSRETLGRLVAVGLVMNAVQFGLMYVAFDLGLDATLSSLFHSLSPVLTVLLAALVLGERVSPVQVVGFLVGVVGVVVVLGPDLDHAGGPLAVAMGASSMFMLSLGTLGQRWVGEAPDLLWATTIQFAVSAPPMLVLGWLAEGAWPVTDTATAIVSVVFIVVVNSLLGLGLLSLLVRRGGSGAAASLFFAAPPVTAVLAWLVLGDTLDARQLVGLVIAVAGVAAATRSRTAAPVP